MFEEDDDDYFIETIPYSNGSYDAMILGIRIVDNNLEFYMEDLTDGFKFWHDYVGENCRLWILDKLENLT